MFERFSRSWQLMKASADVLRQDRQLLLFPLISAVAMLVVVLAFILPVIGMQGFDGLDDVAQSPGRYALVFLFYVAQYSVIFFFNAALVSAAMVRLDGGTPAIGAALATASSKFGAILGYALIAATVGMVLRMIQERVGFVGRIVVAILGASWSLATFLVVPVLVANDVGPIEAVKTSTSLLKRTWGESVIGQGGLGAAFALMYAVLAVGFFAMIIAIPVLGAPASLILAVAVLAIGTFMLMALIHSALAGIYAAALYRYASQHGNTPGFDPQLLQAALGPKKS